MEEPLTQQPQQTHATAPKLQVQPKLQGPPHESKKALIIIASTIGFLVIVGMVTAVLMVAFSVSKKDYRAALAQYEKITSTNRQLGAKVSSLSYGIKYSSSAAFTKNTDEARRLIKEIRHQNVELSEMKAVRSGEGKKLYQPFSSKVASYTTYADNMVSSLNDTRTTLLACNTAASSSSTALGAKQAADVCVGELKKVRNTPDADLRNYLNVYQTQMGKLSSVAGQLASITDPNGAQRDRYAMLRRQVLEVQGSIKTEGVKLQDNMNAHEKEVSPAVTAEALSTYLMSKSRG